MIVLDTNALSEVKKLTSRAAAYPVPISALNSARSASIGMSPFAVSTCQNAQPLQASSPCASAPMRWIEPTVAT